jgi:hypothetical protein
VVVIDVIVAAIVAEETEIFTDGTFDRPAVFGSILRLVFVEQPQQLVTFLPLHQDAGIKVGSVAVNLELAPFSFSSMNADSPFITAPKHNDTL